MAWLTKWLRKLFPWLLLREFDALNEHQQEHIRLYYGMGALPRINVDEFFRQQAERNKRYHS